MSFLRASFKRLSLSIVLAATQPLTRIRLINLVYIEKHGITSRFLEYFRIISEQTKQKTAELDAQTGVSQKAAGAYAQADEKVKINDKANKAWSTGKSCVFRHLPICGHFNSNVTITPLK